MNHNSTRRAFFAHGGAVLGAGVASTVGASALATPVAAAVTERAADREAIRALQSAFVAAIERGAWADAAALFSDGGALEVGDVRARGRVAIREALGRQASGDGPMHAAYRTNASRGGEAIELRDGTALASFSVDVKVHVPLKDDCTAATMARLQGQLADVRWESGRLEASCVQRHGSWALDSLRYRAE